MPPLLDFFTLAKQTSPKSPTPAFPYKIGDPVYIAESYYVDLHASYAEVPRFGWTLEAVKGNVATIKYHRKHLSLSLFLDIDCKYLKKEV